MVVAAASLVLSCGLSEYPAEEPEGPGGTRAGAEGSDPEPGGGSAGGSGGSNGGTGAGGNAAPGNGGASGSSGPRGGQAGGQGGGNPEPPDDPGGAGGQGGSSAADAGSPPAAEPGITINGTMVPRSKAIVFLHIGHSNMAGRTNTPDELRPFNFQTHPQLWSFAGGMWRPAKEPLSGDYLTRGRAGPGMSILRTALDLAPDAYMISIGRGQDGSRGGECKAFRRGGLLYDLVMEPAIALKDKVTFGGIFSMLVLMAIFDEDNLDRHHECLEAVAADMRADLGDPNVPFVMSDWEMGATGLFDPTRPDAVVARQQLKIAQQNIPRSVIVPTEDLPMSDDHHFDLVGYKMWAERAFTLMKQNEWLPWAASAD